LDLIFLISLNELLTPMTKKIVLLDGGMGQELIKRSGQKPTPLWSARVLLDNPELVQELHSDFIKAGAQVISLNNYTATPFRLRRDASIDLFDEIHQSAKTVAKAAKINSGKENIKIAGSLGPVVASYKPELVPSYSECLHEYKKLVKAQEDGVDLFICETMSTIREAKASVFAANETGLPTCISFTLDDHNPLMLRSGESLLDAVKEMEPLNVESIMINCSMPETINHAVPLLVNLFPRVGAYANGFQSIDGLKAGGTVESLKARKDLTPDLYLKYALEWVDMGVSIVGGCCEVGPKHIEVIYNELLKNGFSFETI